MNKTIEDLCIDEEIPVSGIFRNVNLKVIDTLDSLKILKTEEDYNKALKQIAQLMDTNPTQGSDNFNHLEVLALIIEDYESKHCRIDKPSPDVAIKFRMEQQGE